MELTVKVAAAFYTPDGIVADTPEKSALASYKIDSDENTYKLYVSSELAPAGVAAKIKLKLDAGDTIFMNGFQSATDSRELGVSGKMNGLTAVSHYIKEKQAAIAGGDYAFVPYKNKPGVTHGFSYCYFRHGNNIKLFASLDESAGYTIFKFDAMASTLRISKDVEGVDTFDNYPALSFFYAEGEENEVFDKWFAAMGEKETHPAEKLIGYSTADLRTISEDVIYDRLDAMGAFPVEANTFIVEGKYCVDGDWLSCDKQLFPVGFRAFVDDAHSKGLTVGLGFSPFTADERSDVVASHPDWILRSRDGKFVKTKNNLLVLDACNSDVKEYVRETLHTVLFMWGFDLVKLNDLCLAGLVPADGKSRGERMCETMKFLRDCCGGKLLYADNVPLMSAFGLADYCAVSCEASSDYIPFRNNSRLFRESASVRNACSDIVFRRQLDGRAFMNAPCYVSFDEKENFIDGNLNNAEQNLLGSLCGLFTSVLITTDDVYEYNQKNKRRFKKMCSMEKAKDIKIRKSLDRYVVSYKISDKKYYVKF